MSNSNVKYTLFTLLLVGLSLLGVLATGCSSDDATTPVTPPVVDTTAPGEITDLLAVPGDGQVTLSWINPQEIDLTGIMLRRGTDTAPTIETGEIVFEGLAGSFVDEGVTNDTVYYYTAFTYDNDENYSTGVNTSCTPHVASVISIPDLNLDALIRAELGIPAGDITDLDMLTLTELSASDQSIANLQGLEYCLNMQDLNLNSTGLTDAGHTEILSGLTKLVSLEFEYNDITIVPDLSNLTSLERLYMMDNPIVSLSPLEQVTSLVELQFGICTVSDLTPLESMVNLEYLYMWRTDISSLDGLENMTSLERLFVSFSEVSDLTPLSGLTNLASLSIIGGHITDLSVLGSLDLLQTVNMSNNLITDLNPLAGLTNLEVLSIGSNPVRSIAALSSVGSLENLWAAQTEISNISTLTNLSALLTVNLDNCPLTTDDVQTVIPSLEGAGVDVTFNYDLDLVELMGPWSIASVTVDGVDTAPADFFEWDPAAVRNIFTVYPYGEYHSEDLDVDDNVVYHEIGTFEVAGTAVTITVVTEDGVDVHPPYVAFEGTWTKTAGDLVFNGDNEGTPFILTWSR